jgi:single-stranded-DNA-specific exonuclease
MDRAVSRIARALHQGEKITLYGDYDVDGTTAVAVLFLFFRNAGAPVEFFVPHRVKEGYGLNLEAVKNIRASGTRLLITADCGISGAEEIRWAGENGLDVIVTDHHEVPEEVPPALAVLNPKQRDCPFPFKGMAGVGVAFNLLIALRSALRKNGFFPDGGGPNLKEYLDRVALGTVSDVVPLTGPNRILVKYGLQELSRSSRPGIIALKEVSDLDDAPVDTTGVNFRLAPRINAAGRLEDAAEVVRLLTTDDPGEARRLAAHLNELNSLRQRIEEKILIEARGMIAGRPGEAMNSLVLASEGWHPGVIGIVASRLAEEFHRPTILIALQETLGKGSGRSIASFSLYEGLKACRTWMEGFGGHEQAAGLVIRAECIPDFCRAFEATVAQRLTEEDLVPCITLDALAMLEDLEDPFAAELEALAPFGPGNPEPVLGLEGLQVVSSRVVGKDHLRVGVKQGRFRRDAIGFGMGRHHPLTGAGMKMAFVPQVGSFRGRRTLQLKIIDLQNESS